MASILSRPQCVNLLSLTDAYMHHWTGLTLGQVMAPHHAITWTNADFLSTEPLGTYFSEIQNTEPFV